MLTPKQFADRMRELDVKFDTEGKHSLADQLMCAILTELGYGEGVKVYEAFAKWYA